jgi:DNA-binding SARP family transcriptional activator/DNA polymerase III delta prime subunit
MLEIRLLGQFDLRRNGRSVHIHSRPAQLLLAYLALRVGMQHRREKLAGLIWPDMAEENARRNLRNALWRVRKAIGERYIQADRLSVGFDQASPHWIDCAVLRASRDASSLDAWVAAVSLYQDELLPGFYEEWVILDRKEMQTIYDRRMGSLLERLGVEARWEEVTRWAEHWIAHGGFLEPAFRAMIRAKHELGDIAGVAATYRRCVAMLDEELGVAPSQETKALFQKLSGDAPLHGQESPVPEAQEVELSGVSAHRSSMFQLLNRLTGSRLIGRDYELAELQRFWKQARDGRGHLLVIAGEAGIGKTQLAQQLAREVMGEGGSVLHGHYYAEIDAPYLGFWEALRDQIRGMDPEHAGDAIGGLAPELVKLVPEISEIIGPVAPNPPLGTADAERIRLFDQVSQFIGRLAASSPLLFVLDDLHWAGEASAALLGYVLRQLNRAPVLFVVTHRDNEIGPDHPLQATFLDLNRERLYTRLKLLPLPEKQVIRMLRTLLAGAVTPELGETVVQISGGNPLFVEEVVKSLLEKEAICLESGRWRQVREAGAGVPQPIDQMIKARIAGFSGDCQSALKRAAVLGQSFDPAALRHMLGWEEKRLLDVLDEALQSGVVVDGGVREGGPYRFNHVLVQQALYRDLTAWQRAQAHLGAGAALEAVYAGGIGETVETLAHHFMRAGEEGGSRAVAYLLRAAEKAAAVYAHNQAIADLRRGLALLASYPSYPNRVRDEIRLLLVLGPLLENTAGRWDDEVGRIFARAEELCRQTGGSIEEHFTATRGLWLHHFASGDGTAHRELIARLVTLAGASGDSGLLLEAYHMNWAREIGAGNTGRAQKYLELGRELFDFRAHRHLSRRFGHDPGTCCLNMGGWNLWLMGYPDQALAWSREAYELGERMALPFDRLCGVDACVLVHELRREQQKADDWNVKKLALAKEAEIPYFSTGALCSLGLALAWQGQHAEGFAHAKEAMQALRSAPRFDPLTFIRFLQVCLVTGRVADGLQVMEDGTTWRKFVGEGLLEPEVTRLHGELLWMQDGNEIVDVEAKFHSALDMARKQGARSLELRAAMSLARVWQAQGEGKKAQQLLHPIYAWFTEGLDTADLVEARQLLGVDPAAER